MKDRMKRRLKLTMVRFLAASQTAWEWERKPAGHVRHENVPR